MFTCSGKAGILTIHSVTRMCLCKVVRGKCHLFFKTVTRSTFMKGVYSRLTRWEVHLALWDALVIEGYTAWTCSRSKATDAKKEKKKLTTKTKEKYTHRQELQLAPEGGISLTWHPPSLDGGGGVKDKSMKAKESTCECVFYCLCVVDFSAASAPWRCLSVAKGPQPWPRISRRAVSTQHFPSPLVN